MIVLSKIREHFPVRRLEWACAAIIAGLGARLLDPADKFAQPSLRELVTFPDKGTWGTAMLLIGGLRMIVLAYNEAWRPSPELRGLFAITCGIIFAALTFGLEAAGTASTGPVPTWSCSCSMDRTHG
jgi:hypothetical protein